MNTDVRVITRPLLAAVMLAGLLGSAVVLLSAAPAHAAPHAAAAAASMPTHPAMRFAAGCPGLDIVCEAGGATLDHGRGVLQGGADVLGGLPGLPGAGVPGSPGIPGAPDPSDLFSAGIPGLGGLSGISNPLDGLGEAIAKAAVDAWTAAMLAIWSSGLFILRIVLTFSEMFLIPDLRADGPGRDVYGLTLWLAGALVVILTLVQLGAAAFKREGKGLARALIGAGQFVLVCACWFGYCTLIVAACGALTRALMKALLGVSTWPDWEPLGGLGTEDITDGTVATELAFLGLFLWIAAIGHILVYLARAASLLVLTATGPLAASGLVTETTRSWFWKSLRWFHAAAFTPVLMVIVLGIGVQMVGGVAAHLADGAQKSIGTALPAVMLILVSVVAPLALFKLLAFVDPGTPSGSSFRQGMGAVGGLQGLLSGGGSAASGGSNAASTSDDDGRSAGESSAESSTGDRFTQSTRGLLGGPGPVGAGVGAGIGMITSMGAKAAGLLTDQTNQAGVGQNTYGPDFSAMRSDSQSGRNGLGPGRHPHGDHDSDDPGNGGDSGGGGGIRLRRCRPPRSRSPLHRRPPQQPAEVPGELPGERPPAGEPFRRWRDHHVIGSAHHSDDRRPSEEGPTS